MKSFRDKVAVITGGASGIGYAFAEKAVKEGMKVVIADIRADALETSRKQLEAQGGEVLAVTTDVTKNEDIKDLAKKTLDRFGKVNLLFNNAGVAPTGITWDTSPEIYRWVFDINIMGVAYGITTFVPLMLEQGDECHVINTASGAALFSFAGFGLYCTSKHAVLALSEALWLDLAAKGKSNIGVTVVMPGYVKSDVSNWAKTTPSENMKNEIDSLIKDPISIALSAPGAAACAEDGNGMEASAAAEMVFDAISRNELYVLPNNEVNTELDKAVAAGRISGVNSYPSILSAMQSNA